VKEHIGRILLSENTILERVRELGQQISNDYRGRELILLCVLKGSVIFLADLIRNIDIHAELDFIQISSYGNATESTGEIKVLLDLTIDIENQNVLVVEDIVDSGLTLRYLKDMLLAKRPASLKVCALLDKTESGTEDLEIDYVGFRIPPDEFVVGYGLDYAGKYRGLRYIAALGP
jgi:hypoxanthine phosphoribosyltransferase